MKKKIIIGLIIVLVCIIIVTISSIFLLNNDKSDKVIVSYSNSDSEKFKIIETTENKANKLAEKNKYVKIDKQKNIKTITKDELSKLIKKATDNEFLYGISLLDGKINLLSEEINSYNLVDFKERKLDIEKINNYIKNNRDITFKITEMDNITTFKTDSVFISDGERYELKNEIGFNIRPPYNTSNNIKTIMDNATSVIQNMIKENGEYIYGYEVNSAEIVKSYNILRHAGTSLSLLQQYNLNPNEELKNQIESTVSYLVDNYLYEKDDMVFVVEKVSSEIKLGGNGLALLMLVNYAKAFDTNKYDDIMRKMADGILYMQLPDGYFYHVYNLDLTLKAETRINYYDGEALNALMEYYEYCNTKKYYDVCKKALDYYVNHAKDYYTQWMAYALQIFLKYDKSDKYVKFALDHYTGLSESNYYYKKVFSPTRLEQALIVFEMYNYLNENDVDVSSFDIEGLKVVISNNAYVVLMHCIYPEVALYFKKPEIAMYGFYDLEDDFRMRIDDIQHAIMGLNILSRSFY